MKTLQTGKTIGMPEISVLDALKHDQVHEHYLVGQALERVASA